MSNGALRGIQNFAIDQFPVASFVAIRNFSALGDTFGLATVDQLTAIPHYYVGNPGAMLVALQPENSGMQLAAALSTDSLWFYSDDFEITAKLLEFKQKTVAKPYRWSILGTSPGLWNWAQMNSILKPPTTINWLEQQVAAGLRPSALVGFHPGKVVYSTTSLGLRFYQYFLPDASYMFPAASLNVRFELPRARPIFHCG